MNIPIDQIAVVTGDPRSGTSLMMQTLMHLGVPVAGDKFPTRQTADEDEARDLRQRAEQMNPRGFYEVKGVVMGGLRDLDDNGGKAIKIIAPGLTRTPTDLVWRGILCLRDPRHVAQSQTRLQGNIHAAGVRGWDTPQRNASPTRYMLEMGGFLKWWRAQSADFRSRFIVVDYDVYLDRPVATVARIAAHMDVTAAPEAVANVDPSLRRSPGDFIAWPQDAADDGARAEGVYRALLSGDEDDAALALADIDSAIDYHRRESTIIYHRDLCGNVRAGFMRQYDGSPQLRDRLMRTRPERLQRGMSFETSPDYRGEAGEDDTYTLRLPLDQGGDREVRKVIYQNVVMTREEAQATHEQRRRTGEVAVDGKRVAKMLREVAHAS